MTEWDIQPRSPVCTACQTPFADRANYHTLLLAGPEGYRRRDLCDSCIGTASRDGVISYWQAQYRMPAPPAPEPIQKETAETLLKKLVEAADPAQAAPCYILAVMLERKRILKHRGTVRDETGNELLVYEHAGTGESFTLPDPHLRLDQLEEVQRQVAELLQPASPQPDRLPASGERAGDGVS
jgi:hypothetical protein